jgi:hypothetical protein
MSVTPTRSFSPQRIRYFQHQKLTARDLEDSVTYETRMHGMHLRGLHDTWGIALGYEVSLSGERDRVIIGPGIAYDCHGRAIISSRVLQAELPPLPANFSTKTDRSRTLDLVISFRQGAGLSLGNYHCLSDGPSLAEERPDWRWVPVESIDGGATPDLAEGVRLGEEIPLARFVIDEKTGISDPDYSHRRSAQGLVRPHFGSGKQREAFQFSESQLAFTVHIDTSAAGFTTTPRYFANLESHPFLNALDEDDPDQLQLLRFVQGPFLTIRNASTTGFDLDIRFARIRGTERDFNKFAETLSAGNPLVSLTSSDGASAAVQAAVNWYGIEDVGGCIQPLFMIIAFFLPAIQLLPAQILLGTDD